MPKKPKVSVNKLAEFVGADSGRQQTIVKDQAVTRPPGVKAFRYSEVRAASVRYFVDGFNLSILDDEINKLSKKIILNKHDLNYQKTSIESLNELKKIDMSQFKDLQFTSFRGKSLMDINGVDVNVCPDLIIRGMYKKKKVIGAVKFHIKKEKPLDEKAQTIVATILNKFIDSNLKLEDEKALPQLMISIDIFGGDLISAPKTYKKIFNDVASSCDIYKLIWASLFAPLAT